MKQTIPIDELLEHAGWLRRLASSLVKDAGVAEDLVQETWVAALRHPPEDGSSPRPWLSRVVRNLAKNRRRARVRRQDREELAPSPGSASARSPESLAEEAEAQRVLAEAVSTLDEPLRSVIVLRYFRGLESRAIAKELGIAPGTVRWRLGRAREELRTLLDERFGGDRRSWALAFGAVLQRRGTSEPAVATLLGGSTPSTVLVTLSVAAGLSITLLATGLFPRLDWTRDPSANNANVQSGHSVTSPVAVEPGPLAKALTETSQRSPVSKGIALETEASSMRPARADNSTAFVSGHVLVDGLVPNDPIKLRVETPGLYGDPPRFLYTEEAGAFSIRLSEQHERWVIKAPAFVAEAMGSYQSGTGARAGLQVRLESRPYLTGRILDPATGGPPAPTSAPWDGSYTLTGSPAEGGESHAGGVLSLDDEGRFYISLDMTGELHGKLYFERRGIGRRVVSVASYDPAEGGDLGDIVLEPGGELTFQVRDDLGNPVPESIAKHEDSDRVVQTGADGKQSLAVVSRDGAPIRFAALRHVDQVLTAHGDEHLDIALERSTALDLTFTGLGKEELKRVRIVVENRDAFEEPGIFGNAWSLDGRVLEDSPGGRLRYGLGGSGHVVLQHVRPDTPVRIEVLDSSGQLLAIRDVALAPKEWRELTIALRP